VRVYIYIYTHTHIYTQNRPLAYKVVYSERNQQTFPKKPASPSRSPIKAVPPSKNSVNFYQTTLCHVPEGSILHSRSRKKSQISSTNSSQTAHHLELYNTRYSVRTQKTIT